ncbi:MAG: DUF433 domain-containing protein [Pirellulaceae bacterium]|nr:DUF433 domain-containing protein [Pirellulaceae bacterium]
MIQQRTNATLGTDARSIMRDVRIIERGRGPEIEGTRITVFHVWEFYRGGDDRDDIALTFGLSSRQVQAAIDYIDANRQQVEDQYARIEERIKQGNSEKLEEQFRQSRERLQERLRRKDHQTA